MLLQSFYMNRNCCMVSRPANDYYNFCVLRYCGKIQTYQFHQLPLKKASLYGHRKSTCVFYCRGTISITINGFTVPMWYCQHIYTCLSPVPTDFPSAPDIEVSFTSDGTPEVEISFTVSSLEHETTLHRKVTDAHNNHYE